MIGRIYKITLKGNNDFCYIGSTAYTLRTRWTQHKLLYEAWVKGEGNAYSIFPYFKEHGIKNFKISLLKEYPVVDHRHVLAYEQLWLNKFKHTAVNKKAAVQLIPRKICKRLYSRKKQAEDPEGFKKRNKASYQKIKNNPSYVEKARATTKAYYEANKEKVKEYAKAYQSANKDKAKAYREANKDKLKEKKQIYQEANKERLSAKNKEKYQSNKEKLKAQRESNKDKSKEYYQANKEKLAIRSKERYQANKEAHKAYVKEYYKANKEKATENASRKIHCECGSVYKHAHKSDHLRTKKHTQWVELQQEPQPNNHLVVASPAIS